ncbi:MULTISPECIES: N-acetyltransferase [Arthrobacter]|nr:MULTISPECIES: GNAT family N-acetyltransferase [Arthrobacter]
MKSPALRTAETVWLIPLKSLDDDALAITLGEAANMELAPGQESFVGDPFKMMFAGLQDESRQPYLIEAAGAAVGVLTLQSGAATLAGWSDDESAWLLRGFVIDRRCQGRGLGSAAAATAVREALKLTARLGGGQAGVVLSVNEANPAARSAYENAGFTETGRFLGGSAGPQWTMYRAFEVPRHPGTR